MMRLVFKKQTFIFLPKKSSLEALRTLSVFRNHSGGAGGMFLLITRGYWVSDHRYLWQTRSPELTPWKFLGSLLVGSLKRTLLCPQ